MLMKKEDFMETRQKKLDRRWLRTKKSIRNAVVEQIAVKDISKITVTEVAKIADINRKTFYLHYDSVYSVLNEIENDVANMIMKILNKIDLNDSYFDPYLILNEINTILNSDIDFYGNVMKSPLSNNLINKIKNALKVELINTITVKLNISNEALSVYIEFLATGILVSYQQWFNSKSKLSLEKLSKAIGQIAFYGINGLLEQR